MPVEVSKSTTICDRNNLFIRYLLHQDGNIEGMGTLTMRSGHTHHTAMGQSGVWIQQSGRYLMEGAGVGIRLNTSVKICGKQMV